MKSKPLINYYKHKFVHVISGVVSFFYSNGREKISDHKFEASVCMQGEPT